MPFAVERGRRPGATENGGIGIAGRQDTTHRVRQMEAQFANHRGPIPWDLLDSHSTQTDTATSQRPSDTAATRVRVHWRPRSTFHSTSTDQRGPAPSDLRSSQTDTATPQQSSPFTDVPLGSVQPAEICLFCFVPYHDKPEEQIVHLRCDKRHIFHRECIRPWIDERRSCPTCRAPM